MIGDANFEVAVMFTFNFRHFPAKAPRSVSLRLYLAIAARKNTGECAYTDRYNGSFLYLLFAPAFMTGRSGVHTWAALPDSVIDVTLVDPKLSTHRGVKGQGLLQTCFAMVFKERRKFVLVSN